MSDHPPIELLTLKMRLEAYQRAFNAIDDLMEYRGKGMRKDEYKIIAERLTQNLMGDAAYRKDEDETGTTAHLLGQPVTTSPAKIQKPCHPRRRSQQGQSSLLFAKAGYIFKHVALCRQG